MAWTLSVRTLQVGTYILHKMSRHSWYVFPPTSQLADVQASLQCSADSMLQISSLLSLHPTCDHTSTLWLHSLLLQDARGVLVTRNRLNVAQSLVESAQWFITGVICPEIVSSRLESRAGPLKSLAACGIQREVGLMLILP